MVLWYVLLERKVRICHEISTRLRIRMIVKGKCALNSFVFCKVLIFPVIFAFLLHKDKLQLPTVPVLYFLWSMLKNYLVQN